MVQSSRLLWLVCPSCSRQVSSGADICFLSVCILFIFTSNRVPFARVSLFPNCEIGPDNLSSYDTFSIDESWRVFQIMAEFVKGHIARIA